MATIVSDTTVTITDEAMEISETSPRKSVEDLIQSLDTCNRTDLELIPVTLSEIILAIKDEEPNEVACRERMLDAIKTILLIALRRRNHLKSLVDGDGAGEKRFLIEVLLAIIRLDNETYSNLVERVLPFISSFGCWRDLRILAEELIIKELKGSDSEKVESIKVHPIVSKICVIFVDQMKTDSAEINDHTPSNAAKYAPHEGRYKGKAHERTEGTASSRAGAGRGGRVRGGRGGRGRGRAFKASSTPMKAIDAMNTKGKTKPKSIHQKATSILVDEMGRYGFPHEFSQSRHLPALRKLRVKLNEALTKAGHLLEPLISDKEKREEIDFIKANKGSLSKYQTSIKKDPILAKKWADAMKKSIKAIPDLVNIPIDLAKYLSDFSDKKKAIFGELTEEEEEGGMEVVAEEGKEGLDFFPHQIKKAISTLIKARNDLEKKAKSLLNAAGTKAGDGKEGESDSKEASYETIPSLVVVDTSGKDNSTFVLSLLLSAFIVAKAQSQSFIVVDGEIVSITEMTEVDCLEQLGRRFAVNPISLHTDPMARFRTACHQALQMHRNKQEENYLQVNAERKSESFRTNQEVDMLFFCYDFIAYEDHARDVQSEIQALQSTATAAANVAVKLRCFRLHRMKQDDSDFAAELNSAEGIDQSSVIPFRPRTVVTADQLLTLTATELTNGQMPSSQEVLSSMTADLLLVVDFTGSMGSYMTAVKRELVQIIQTIQSSGSTIRLKDIRVGLIGYRDYQDQGRVVVHDFQSSDQLDALITAIQAEEPSGGGDAPEDMLSAFVAAKTVSWQSDMRLQVIISDAEAHGFAKSGDHHPSGRCPDQLAEDGYPSLKEAVEFLAVDRRVDTFYCLLNNGTQGTQKALASVYDRVCEGKGFGSIALGRNGIQNFQKKIIAAISYAVLSTITSNNIEGLQSNDGVTLSSLSASLTSAVRETLNSLSSDEPEGNKKSSTKKASTNWEKLTRELAQDYLTPIRLALGMPVSHKTGALTTLVQYNLWKGGVTVSDLEQNQYPVLLVESYRQYLQQVLAKL